MRVFVILIIFMVLASSVYAAFDVQTGTISNEKWKSGTPIGGIGCGKLEIFTDGNFGHYTGNHNWDRPTGKMADAFAAVYASAGDKHAAKMLRLNGKSEYSNVENIAAIDYTGWFPTASLKFKDQTLPVDVEMLVWSPLIPNNIADSSLPVACFRFTVHNPNKTTSNTSVMLSWPNLIGWGHNTWGDSGQLKDNTQKFIKTKALSSLVYEKVSKDTSFDKNNLGKYVLCTASKDWKVSAVPEYDSDGKSLSIWDSFSKTGLSPTTKATDSKRPAGAMIASATLQPGETRTLDFVLVWHFPNYTTVWNRMSATDKHETVTESAQRAIDGSYDTRWDTGRSMLPGDRYELDMGAERKFTRIILDAHKSHCDWPRGYRIELSNDNKTWHKVKEETLEVVSKRQSGGLLPIDLDKEENARYIRIVQHGQDTLFWSIDEFEVYNKSEKLSTEGWKGTGYPVIPAINKIEENIGHYYSNKFSDPLQIASYVIKNQDRLLSDTQELRETVGKSNLPDWLKLKMINSSFPAYTCTILTRDGRFAIMESPIDMGGALGTNDQRMASHAFWTQMFPELDKSELRLFAKCQDLVEPVADGRISHFNGNMHQIIGNPNVGYGVTDWPDLSCSFIMQVLKLYRWTGDKKFMDDMWPHVQHALAWLASADVDGDSIPEGGSTYDYEAMPRGVFCYSAMAYLGALRAGINMAQIQKDSVLEKTYTDRFNTTQQSVMKSIWNGKFFIKHIDTSNGKRIENSFIAQLAGDWLSRISGAGRTLSPEVTESTIREIIARNVKPFYPMPPMEVTPEGKMSTQTCYAIQHEPYAGCEAINEGYTDDGLEVIRRLYVAAWEQNRDPWNQSLGFQAPSGIETNLFSYMTCPTTWHVLNALSGTTIDVLAKTLHISPKIGKSLPELHMPVFFSRAWLWMDYEPAKKSLKIKTLKTFGQPFSIETVKADAEAQPIQLAKPFTFKEGESLDLSAYIDKLIIYSEPKVVDYEVRAPAPLRPGLSCKDWTGESGLGDENETFLGSPSAAYDGDKITRWSTNTSMSPGNWMSINFGRAETIKKVVLDSSDSAGDFARKLTVYTSDNGTDWKAIMDLDESQCDEKTEKGVMVLELQPIKTQHIKFVQNGSHGLFWSIHEIYIY